MKTPFTLTAIAVITALLCGCQSVDEHTKGSDNALIEDANVSSVPSTLQSTGYNKNRTLKFVDQKVQSDHETAQESNQDLSKIVPDTTPASVSLESVNESNTVNDEGSLVTIPTGMLPPVDENTADEIAELPDYATASGRQTCPINLNESAASAASLLTAQLLAKLQSDTGEMYAAPTVIPDEYADCIKDVSLYVAKQITASNRFSYAKGSDIRVSQNAGSSSLIPRTVRECRRLNIPYLAVSVVRKLGGNVALTVRIIRVNTGVTLTQAYKKLN